jgi:hypothetical protein
MASDGRAAGRALSDVLRAQPADATLRNLLEALGAELTLCGRLTVFEYEARQDGHVASAEAFGRVAEIERQSFDVLIRCLQQYLADHPAPST